jgi:hypothetical protein
MREMWRETSGYNGSSGEVGTNDREREVIAFIDFSSPDLSDVGIAKNSMALCTRTAMSKMSVSRLIVLPDEGAGRALDRKVQAINHVSMHREGRNNVSVLRGI